MTIEDWVVLTNLLVAVSSILAAAATEHEAVKAMRDTILGVVHAILGNNNNNNETQEDQK